MPQYLVIGYTDLKATEGHQLLYGGSSRAAAMEALEKGAEGLAMASLYPSPTSGKNRRYITSDPSQKNRVVQEGVEDEAAPEPEKEPAKESEKEPTKEPAPGPEKEPAKEPAPGPEKEPEKEPTPEPQTDLLLPPKPGKTK